MNQQTEKRIIEIIKEIEKETEKSKMLSSHIDRCTKQSDKIKLGLMIVVKSVFITNLINELTELCINLTSFIMSSEEVFKKGFESDKTQIAGYVHDKELFIYPNESFKRNVGSYKKDLERAEKEINGKPQE